jgi:guanine nucleotide-binding protein alpha-1 subunit
MAGRSSISSEDPFEVYLRPPANETPEEREARINAEEEALRISQAIDEVLRAERVAAKKRVGQLRSCC